MPLKLGKYKKAISENVSELMRAGYKQPQAIAIAMHEAERSKRKKAKQWLK